MALPAIKNMESTPHTDFTTVTEYPGVGASQEQLDILRTRYELARSLSVGKDALEIACGTGTGLGYVGRTTRSLRANDIDPANLETVRKHYGERFQIDLTDAQNLPYPDASFDTAFLLETIYYLPDPEACAREVLRVLRPGGTFLISSSNREWEMFNPSPFTHTYLSAGELRGMLDRVGFKRLEVMAGFPDKSEATWMRTLRQLAVRYKLIPETMEAKEKIKRLVYGNLTPIPAEANESTGKVHPLFDVDLSLGVSHHKIIYAIGRKPE
jgi:ubiquinone/menaquinone biosynthesis C-methylase UbiE